MGVCGEKKEVLDENEKKRVYAKKQTDRCVTVEEHYSAKEKISPIRRKTLYWSNLSARKNNCE
jgi:hypothetical protein